jgi:hypothetical protein
MKETLLHSHNSQNDVRLFVSRDMAGDNRGTPNVLRNEIGHIVANEQEGVG